MKFSDVKNKKDIVVREPKYLETAKAYEETPMRELADKKEGKLSSFVKKRQERKEKKFTEMAIKTDKQSIKLAEYQKKLEMQKAKAELARTKAEVRKYSVRSRVIDVGKSLLKRPEPGGKVQRQKRLAIESETRGQIALQRGSSQEMKRQIAQQRSTTQYEREQYSKYGVRGEGDGEMPFYEKEHKRPLPQKPQITSSTITNGHRIKPKKSLRDELL